MSGVATVRSKNIIFNGIVFFFHQLLSTIGVAAVAACVALSATPLLKDVFGSVDYQNVRSALTQGHLFPIQTLFALLASFLIAQHWRQRLMLWVWILPTVIFTGKFIVAAQNLHLSALVAHFFGGSCQLRNGCYDQVVFTLPLYTAVAYSLGAWLGLYLSDRKPFAGGTTKVHASAEGERD